MHADIEHPAPPANALPPHAEPSLDVGRLFSQSWSAFAAAPVAWMVAMLVTAVGGAITLGVGTGPLLVGLIRMAERQRRGDPIAAGMVFDGFERFVPAVLTCLAVFIGVSLASLVVVLPGVVLSVLWCFALTFVALDDRGVVEALRGSYHLAQRHVGPVLVVFLVAVGINLLGTLVAVGWLVTGPLACIVMTRAFAQLGAPKGAA